MSPRRHLVIFAKAPALGRVKRRLARDIGAVAATGFYRQTLDRCARRLSDDPRWRTWLAATPDWAARRPGLWPPSIPRLPQGPGDLGDRMARFLRGLGPEPVVIVGSDIPGLQPSDIAAAFAGLGRSDLAIGPTPDGGYWLIGWAGRRPLPRQALCEVRWSTANARADTLASFGQRTRVTMLAVRNDIDDGAAYWAWRTSKEKRHG